MNSIQRRVLGTASLIYPLALVLAFVGTWTVGRLILGHWPRPSLDDPKTLGGWVMAAHHFTTLLLAVGLPALLLVNAWLVFGAFRDSPRRRARLQVPMLSALLMVAVILVLRWDPLGFVAWHAD